MEIVKAQYVGKQWTEPVLQPADLIYKATPLQTTM